MSKAKPKPKRRRRHEVVIEAHDGVEALALKTALNDPQTRAFMLVVGSLLVISGGPPSLLGPASRHRALEYVHERLGNSTGE